jgi:hypothetical protein
MNTSTSIVINLVLICMFAIKIGRVKVISNLFRKKKSLAILTGGMILLTISLTTYISPLYGLALAAVICGLLWQLGRREQKLLRSISPRLQKILATFFVASIGEIVLSCLPWLPLSLRLGLAGLLIVIPFSIAIAHSIRLRAWVLVSLMVFSSFGAVFLEATLSQPSQAQTVPSNTETIKAGAYIIDMGQPTQTIANGLKPYGLIYELVLKKGIPVKWAINPNKAREGIDFASYKGGPFIIEKKFAADAFAQPLYLLFLYA